MGESPQPPVQTEPEHSSPDVPSRLCLLRFGDERLAVDLSHVSEVFKIGSITPVPGMPPLLVGVANLRGTIVPLVDLRPALGAPDSSAPKYAAVMRDGVRYVGVLIDEVPDLVTHEREDALDTPLGEAVRPRPFLAGFLKLAGRAVGMMDVPRLFDLVEGRMDPHAA
jgi:purine-binding chemotaxis protein CheW